MKVTAKPRLRLTAIFLSGLGVTAVALAALGRIAESGESTRPAADRLRAATAQPPSSQADLLFLERRYAGAYGRYASQADAGDPAAASMALTMLMHGPVLFGSDWSATSSQLQRWSALARQFAGQREVSIAAHDRAE